MSVHWAIMRRELPYSLRCCKEFTERHREFAKALDKESSRLLIVTTQYSKKITVCLWCGAKDNSTGIKIVEPPELIRRTVGPTKDHYIGVDVIEIDEGEYDASKPPPSTEEN